MNRYKTIDTQISNGKRYKTNTIYPNVPPSEDDFYIISSVGDRYDTLALRFYGDSNLWWIIASANRMTKASLVLEPGVQIRIPASKSQALELFYQVNEER